ncbi:MAG: hypothetical protein KAI67_02370 [Candidatus Pacebacteria bacterium]|nr:hypothetical protein [Candidatus Paceibacterota bacterium]
MIKLKKIINIHVFKILISVLCIFSAGILMQSEFIFALLLFICGYILQIDDYVKNLENFNKKIDRFGISKISVSD